ncbi:hypothetical protein LNA02_08000 [Levilactobacillus namurensis]|nr:hypothetical protein LNA02_08000 [Levilactobacillus namurensis]
MAWLMDTEASDILCSTEMMADSEAWSETNRSLTLASEACATDWATEAETEAALTLSSDKEMACD